MDSLLQKLVDIEERYHLYEDRFDGVPAWIYIRYGVLQDELIGRARNRKPSQRDLRGSLWQQIRRLFLVCLDDLSSRRHLRQSDLLFISHERRVKWNGSYRCIYTSPLAEKTDSLCVSVLRGDDYREEPIDRNLVYIGMATIRGEIRELTERLFHRGRYRALVKTVRDRWEKPLDEMARAAGVSLDPDRIAAAGAKKILGAPIARRTLKRLLDTVRPKCIIETVSYEWNRMMINELAHEQKIPVVELQHGSMAADHAAYHYGTDKRIPELPDVIFTYSEYWNRMIRMPGEQTRSIATGFPYFEDQVRLYGGQKRADDRTQILFVSQTSVGQALSQAAVYCAERLDPASWRIVYKLHPTEYTGWKTLYPALAQAEGDILTVVGNSDRNIYELQAESDVQVGVYSTALYEGLGFNLYTILYFEETPEELPSLVEMGMADLAVSRDQLLSLLEKQHSDTQHKDGSSFWEKNALSNMEEELKRIR